MCREYVAVHFQQRIENIYDSKFPKESPLLEKDTMKEDNQNERKKKKKGPTLQELIPLNYLKEKEKFSKRRKGFFKGKKTFSSEQVSK